MNDPPQEPDLTKDSSSSSSWTELITSTHSNDFFHRDFSWNNLHNNNDDSSHDLLRFDPTVTIQPSTSSLAAVREVSTSNYNNPCATSSSSEEVAENSTTASAAKTPSETPKKEKKKAQKRIRQQRFAFMTKSDVDNLEDGYRWRKYGQKAVKNSPFPRSYYRCTNSRCTVKKRVERSSEDPTIVITTYEGQHCHQTIGYPRGGILTTHHDPHSFTSHHHHHHHQHLLPPSPLPNPYYYQELLHQLHRDNNASSTRIQQHSTSENAPLASSNNPSEEGLLGDIVPQTMRNP
ncbi:unnamed protein product [Cochlearia groenlandica]